MVLAPEDLTRSMGYDPVDVPEADDADVFVDVKAHLIADAFRRHFRKPLIWYRINGAEPEVGVESDPPCPVLTPNMWYKGRKYSYAFWPRFERFNEYGPRLGTRYSTPVCLVHNVGGWGYQELIPQMRSLGVRIYGRGSPDGLVQHAEVPGMLRTAIAMVHLKSNDAPGYALYEAMASGCPVICTRRLIWRCRMQELLEPGVTCLAFDRETHDPLDTRDVASCTAEVSEHLQQLRVPLYNRTIGEAGKERLEQLMWRDVDGFRTWWEAACGA